MLPPLARRLLLLNLIAQIGIVVTGGLVRLTGSGLGCPTWPQCVPGSYTPVVEQAQGFHKYIEFGNRTLTGLVLATSLAVLLIGVAQWRRGRPRHVAVLAGLPLIGVIAQALIGGVTVLTGLNPLTVATHFLVSMLLVATSYLALVRLDSPDGPRRAAVRPETRWLVAAIATLTAVILILGTIVTGSGPHSGDADEPVRLGFDPRTVSWLHADAVMLYVGLVVGLVVIARVSDASARLKRASLVLFGVTLAQGLVGYVQYFTGLPEALVAAHMLGACLLVVAVGYVMTSLRVSAPPPELLSEAQEGIEAHR